MDETLTILFRKITWLAALGCALASVTGTAKDRPPNVVLILSDDQAWNDYGFMDHEVIQTPNLDRLAAESLVFTRGYVPSSLCRPSLMSILTGQYPHQHGVVGNDPTKGTDRTRMLKHVRTATTIPTLLAQHGYLCLQTGKWWEGNFKEGGFTHGMTHGDPQRGGRHGDQGLKIGRDGLQPIVEFLDGCGDKPFFVWYAPMMPHTPHTPPTRLLNKYTHQTTSLHVARYYAMCEWFDETCGELLAELDRRKLRENTLVVYVTDNGWIQDPNAGKYAPRSKRSPYDGGLRTPIMLHWPGKIQPQRNDSMLACSIDLAPTILACCGLNPEKEMPGLNLLDLVTGNVSPRKELCGEIFEHDVSDIDDPKSSLIFRWCIDDKWKLIVPYPTGRPELYRIVEDPWEKKDLSTEHPGELRRLTETLESWWPAAGNVR